MARKRPGRIVTLELLRAGPPHNQLLSPLTPYLAVCGEAGATLVHVQWEHAPFARRLEELRYENGVDGDPARRLALLDELGRQIAQLIGSIPALSGVLSLDNSEGTPDVTHLRLVLSASELGLVPYELSKIPAGLQMPADNWLLLQVHIPVCLTRHIRSVPYDNVRWPDQARVLFVASDPDELPFEDHRRTLLDAVGPWLTPGSSTPATRIPGVSCDGELELYGDVLTIIKDASIEDVKALCRAADYSHIHLLAHGGEDLTTEHRSFGIGLRGEIVTGTRFASAITTTKHCGTTQPTIVSLASCDSANIGSVVQAGASFAHSLHQAGVALVIASQFPLSFEGSVTALQRMFVPADGLLWAGGHPICMFHDLRRELLVKNEAHSHDWASLVVYEALPPNLHELMDGFQYRQAKAALKVSEKQLAHAWDTAWNADTGAWVDESLFENALHAARARCERARDALPSEGPYAMEALGLKASNFKTNAEISFQVSTSYSTDDERHEQYLAQCHKDLERAFDEYGKAVEGFLRLRGAHPQLEATLHWVLVQTLTMGTVLGRKMEPDYWGLGRRSAKAYLQMPDPDERAWALGSLSELALLQLANEKLTNQARLTLSEQAIGYIRALIELCPERGAWQIESTQRQFARYRSWWGDDAFDAYMKSHGVERLQDWRVENGVLETAYKISKLLSERMWRSG